MSQTQEMPGTAVSSREEFARRTDPFRRELLAHCYRMLGSTHDAEDAVQETYLNAWRSFDGFEGRSSLRTWLYRIATMACFKALERAGRRPLPSGLGGPSDTPEGAPAPAQPEVPWLEPIPNALFGRRPADPAATVESRQSMRLAFIAALQHLPARQRAVLILRDVLAWRAGEVAELLDTTTIAVNSTLQRARAHLALVAPTEEDTAEPTDPGLRSLIDQYAAAFEKADIVTLTRLLTRDAVFEMPPFATWFTGREIIRRFLGPRLGLPGHFRALPTMANDQPALALYTRVPSGIYRPHAVQVLTPTPEGISHIITFQDSRLFAVFGMSPLAGH
jgi:RNA polymerase sigma-70 factor (ECF subfamily)